MNSKWFPYNSHINRDKPIIFCFGYAGGSASVFLKWINKIKSANVVPVELPGKGYRYKEDFARDIAEIIEPLSKEIIKVVNENEFHFYGHSMGAAIGFYIGEYLQKKAIGPNKLIVSGRQGPQDKGIDEGVGYLSDNDIRKELIRVGGTPREILDNDDIMKFFMPVIRADYCLNDSFSYKGEKLNCSIVANCGSKDYDADFQIMKKWEYVTEKDFCLEEFEGDHFFPFNNKKYLEYIDELILNSSLCFENLSKKIN